MALLLPISVRKFFTESFKFSPKLTLRQAGVEPLPYNKVLPKVTDTKVLRLLLSEHLLHTKLLGKDALAKSE